MFIVRGSTSTKTIFAPLSTKAFTVDTNVMETPLHRVNAMTFYEQVTPFILLAKTFEENPDELFYLILTKEDDWVQVDLKTGENITCEIEDCDM